MRALLALPLLLLGCDSGGPDPSVLDLSGVYLAQWGGIHPTLASTGTWDVDGSDVTLHYDIVDEAGIIDGPHTLTGSYFAATNDLRMTGTFTDVHGYSGTVLYEATVTFGGEVVDGDWTGTYDEDPPEGPNPRIEGLVLTRQ